MRYRNCSSSIVNIKLGENKKCYPTKKVIKHRKDPRLDIRKVSKTFHWDLLTLLSIALEENVKPEFLKTLRGIIRERSFEKLDTLALETVRKSDETADLSSCHRLLSRFLLKIEDDLPGILKPNPMDKFKKSEEKNALTNVKLRERRFIPDIEKLIRRHMALLLGRPPRIAGRHGPGASIGTKKANATEFLKWCLPISVSDDAYQHLMNYVSENSHLESHFLNWPGAKNPLYSLIGDTHLEDVLPSLCISKNFNRLAFVPKNYKSFRTIAIEPTANIYMQLGIHDHLAKRLKKYGIYLESQDFNQKLAKRASVEHNLATIDLSAASDSISYETVKALLPRDWFELLDSLRSKSYMDSNGQVVSYEMFSSMGNGFTFALMTCLFSSFVVAIACLHGDTKTRHLDSCVYGDDIILPSAHVQSFVHLLDYYGFKVNVEKTFTEGPFRESCGKDYYSGYDVSPVYLRGIPKTPVDVVKLHNSLFVWFKNHLFEGFDIVSEYLQKYIAYNPFGPQTEILDSYLFSDEKSSVIHLHSRAFVKGFVKRKPIREARIVPFWAAHWANYVCLKNCTTGAKVYPNWLAAFKTAAATGLSLGFERETLKIRRIYLPVGTNLRAHGVDKVYEMKKNLIP